FLATLNASFALSEVEGHREWSYTPRSFAGAAQFGESLTGIQASLVKIGSNALEQTTPLIDAVKSIDPRPDVEELEAARAILKSAWGEFVTELANPGSPRALRADFLSARLTEPGGYLDRFGFWLGMTALNPQTQQPTGTLVRSNVISLDD